MRNRRLYLGRAARLGRTRCAYERAAVDRMEPDRRPPAVASHCGDGLDPRPRVRLILDEEKCISTDRGAMRPVGRLHLDARNAVRADPERDERARMIEAVEERGIVDDEDRRADVHERGRDCQDETPLARDDRATEDVVPIRSPRREGNQRMELVVDEKVEVVHCCTSWSRRRSVACAAFRLAPTVPGLTSSTAAIER